MVNVALNLLLLHWLLCRFPRWLLCWFLRRLRFAVLDRRSRLLDDLLFLVLEALVESARLSLEPNQQTLTILIVTYKFVKSILQVCKKYLKSL